MNMKDKNFLLACFFAVLFMPACNQDTSRADKLILEDQKENNWWFGVVNHGEQMPLSGEYSADIYGNNYGNQIVPLLLASDGQYIWSDKPLKVNYDNGTLSVESHGGKIYHSNEATSLKEAYRFVR